MPEGHTVHRLAAAFRDGLVGGPVRTSSPVSYTHLTLPTKA